MLDKIIDKNKKKAAPGVGAPEAAREIMGQAHNSPTDKAIITPALGFLQAFLERTGVFYEIAQRLWFSCEAVRQAPPPVYGQGRGVWV